MGLLNKRRKSTVLLCNGNCEAIAVVDVSIEYQAGTGLCAKVIIIIISHYFPGRHNTVTDSSAPAINGWSYSACSNISIRWKVQLNVDREQKCLQSRLETVRGQRVGTHKPVWQTVIALCWPVFYLSSCGATLPFGQYQIILLSEDDVWLNCPWVVISEWKAGSWTLHPLSASPAL